MHYAVALATQGIVLFDSLIGVYCGTYWTIGMSLCASVCAGALVVVDIDTLELDCVSEGRNAIAPRADVHA